MQTNLYYCLDVDGQSARWVSDVSRPDQWNRQFFTGESAAPVRDWFTHFNRRSLWNPAPLAQAIPPEIRVMGEGEEKGKRVLSLQVVPGRQSELMTIFVEKWAESKDGEKTKDQKNRVVRVSIDGKQLFHRESMERWHPHSRYITIDYFGIPADGINLVIESDPGEAVGVVLVEKKLGIPSFPQYKPMPPEFVFHHGRNANVFMVKKTFTFPVPPLEPEITDNQ